MQTLIYNINQNTVCLTDDSGLIITIEEVHRVVMGDNVYSVMVQLNGTSKLISVLRVPVGKTNYYLKNYI